MGSDATIVEVPKPPKRWLPFPLLILRMLAVCEASWKAS